METETLTGEDAHFLAQQFLIDLPALEQIMDLRFERQQGVFAFEVRPAAHFRPVAIYSFAQRRQSFRLLFGQSFEQCRAGDEIQRQAALETPRPRITETFAIE